MTPMVQSILKRWGLFPVPLSGRAIWRSADLGYKHMGVVIGCDVQGTTWVAHNHPDTERIVPFTVFADGRPVFAPPEAALPAELSLLLLEKEVLRGKQYDLLNYNCQHFANRITKGKDESQGVTGTFVTLAFLALGSIIINQEA